MKRSKPIPAWGVFTKRGKLSAVYIEPRKHVQTNVKYMDQLLYFNAPHTVKRVTITVDPAGK